MLKKIIAFFLIVYLVSFAEVALAQDSGIVGPTISPMAVALTLKPGTTTEGHFDYFNGTKKEQKMVVGFRSIVSDANDASASLVMDGNSGMSSWIRIDQSEYVVAAGDKAEIKFKVETPKDAEIGKYYAYIYVSPATDSATSGSTIKFEIGSKIIADVVDDNSSLRASASNLVMWIVIIAVVILLLVLLFIYIKRLKRTRTKEPKRKKGKNV